MNKTDYIFLAIIFTHYVSDFIMQDEKWALGKSKNWGDLITHTVTYSMVWYPILFLLKGIGVIESVPGMISLFVIITFLAHTVTDYFTSRWVSKKFTKGYLGSAIPNFGAFSSIGFDQVLHYLQLWFTFKLLF